MATAHTVKGNCTHELWTLPAMGGANLFWAEIDANPRDITDATEEGREDTVREYMNIFFEVGWDVLHRPSKFCTG